MCLNLLPCDKWKCPSSGKCIDSSKVCNSQNGDCNSEAFNVESNEDEVNCQSHTCAAEHWKCANGKCVYESLVCNGRQGDCSDGSDEINCELQQCSPGYIKCADLKTCVDVSICASQTVPPPKVS